MNYFGYYGHPDHLKQQVKKKKKKRWSAYV